LVQIEKEKKGHEPIRESCSKPRSFYNIIRKHTVCHGRDLPEYPTKQWRVTHEVLRSKLAHLKKKIALMFLSRPTRQNRKRTFLRIPNQLFVGSFFLGRILQSARSPDRRMLIAKLTILATRVIRSC
jgi:hypothetical protein